MKSIETFRWLPLLSSKLNKLEKNWKKTLDSLIQPVLRILIQILNFANSNPDPWSGSVTRFFGIFHESDPPVPLIYRLKWFSHERFAFAEIFES